MKRRLEESSERDGEQPATATAAATGGVMMSDDVKQMVAAMIAKELMRNLSAVSGSRARFGNVGFESSEQQNVNAFLHQKLGKGHLTRRPGPGGIRLTYIESCKAIELANQAFGFNGWSCRIIECKEEYVRVLSLLSTIVVGWRGTDHDACIVRGDQQRTQKADRWSIGFSSLVRIELKDGTSHEDFGFGQADGLRDLGAALEQAKKHIKDVHSNRVPMATNAASPAEMAERATAAMAVSASGAPTVLIAATPIASAPQNAPTPMQPRPQPMQTPPQAGYNPSSSSVPPRHNNGPPAASSAFGPTNTNSGVVGQPGSAANGVASRISAMQAAGTNKRQAIAAAHGGPAAAPIGQQQQQQQRVYQPNPAQVQNQPPAPTSTGASPYGQGQYPNQPLHTIGTNAPPPTRMAGYQPQQTSPIIKTEAARPLPPTEYDMNDLSLSQFDYEPQR